MSERAERHLVVERLREEIRRLERRPGRRGGVLSCGVAAVDGALPGGGFPRGAVAELAGGPASGKTGVALALVASLGEGDLAAWVDGRGELYPPAAAARGVDLARLLVVRPAARGAGGDRAPPGARGGLWAAEALLASGAFAVVAIDLEIPRLDGADAVARRLQAAAERGGAVGLWLGAGRGLRFPGALRLELAAEGERVIARRAVGLDAARPRGGDPRAA